MLENKWIFLLVAMVVFLAPAPTAQAAFFETQDGAMIYYEDQGKGPTVLLVHGWMCSTKFWKSNVPELAKEFRVVAMDMRGHGYSSKILSGHTVPQYGRDIRALIEHLNLKDVTLLGWSLGGTYVLSYWQQYAQDHRLKGFGLIDSNMAPFSQEDWNSHGFKTTTMEGVSKATATIIADRTAYAKNFANIMFKSGKASDADAEWIISEVLKTPPWIALGIYNDFALRDFTDVLPQITVPSIVYAANSIMFKKGIDQGKYVASRIPKCTFVPFEDTAHLLFYEQPAKFNKSLVDFVRGLK